MVKRIAWKVIRPERVRGFEPHSHRKMAPWRNWIAQLASNESVTGSNPVGVTNMRLYTREFSKLLSVIGYENVGSNPTWRTKDVNDVQERSIEQSPIKGTRSSTWLVHIRWLLSSRDRIVVS
jgi:hypothetical protein